MDQWAISFRTPGASVTAPPSQRRPCCPLTGEAVLEGLLLTHFFTQLDPARWEGRGFPRQPGSKRQLSTCVWQEFVVKGLDVPTGSDFVLISGLFYD